MSSGGEGRARLRVQGVGLAALAVCVGAWSAGCSSGADAPLSVGRSTSETSPTPRIAEGADPIAVLQPRIMARGAADAVPSQVLITSLRETLRYNYWRALTPKSALLDVSISPPAPGKWSTSGDRTLRFEPSGDGLAPETTYTVSLKKLPWRGQGVALPKPVSASFTTPAFKLLSVSEPTRRLGAPGGAEVSLTLTFSAPVNPWEVARRVTLTLDGQALQGMPTYRLPADDASIDVRRAVTLTWQDARVKGASALSLVLAEGVPFGTHRAPGVRVERAIPSDARGLRIKPLVVERAAGGEVRVGIFCEDGTPACTLDPVSAAQHITTSPEVVTRPEVARGGLWLTGPLRRGEYTITLGRGLRSASGVTLADRQERVVHVEAAAPALRLAQQGQYTTHHAWTQLALHHVNVGQAEVTIQHVPIDKAHLGWDEVSARTARVVARRHVTLGGEEDAPKLTLLPLRALMAAPEAGLYRINVSSGGLSASLRVVVSETHLIVRRGINPQTRQPELLVWVVGAHDLKPRAGVSVEALRANGSSAGRCTADMAGACTITLEPSSDDSPVRFVTAARGADATILALDGLTQQDDPAIWWARLSTREVLTRVEEAPRAHFKMFPAQRLAQPGEPVSFVVLGRDAKLKPAAHTPVVVKEIDDEGRPTRAVAATTDAMGLATVELIASEDEWRWGWGPHLYVAGEVHDHTNSVGVEVPWQEASLRLHAHSMDRALLQRGTPARFELSAMTPLRVPVVGVEADGRCTAASTPRGPLKAWPGFTFDPSPELSRQVRDLALGTARAVYSADADPYYSGKTVMRCATEALPQGAGHDWLVTLEARQDVGNRFEALDRASVRVTPEPFWIGLKAPEAPLEAGQTIEIEGVVVEEVALAHPERALKASDARHVARQAVKTVEITTTQPVEQFALLVDDAEGRAQWRVTRRQDATGPTITAPVDAQGRFRVRLTPKDARRDMFVRARAGRAVADVKLAGSGKRRYDWAGAAGGDPANKKPEPAETRRADRADQAPKQRDTLEITPRWPDPVKLKAKPETARVGEPVEIAFRAPFRGRALWTIETDHVVSWAWQDVQPGAQSWTFTPKPDAQGPLRVVLTLFKDPHLESPDTYLPSTARGIVSVAISPDHLKQAARLDVAKEIRAGQDVPITIALGQPYEPGSRAVVFVEERQGDSSSAWPDVLSWFTREVEYLVLGAQTLDDPLSVRAQHLRAERIGGGITVAQQLNTFYSYPKRWKHPLTVLDVDARGQAKLVVKAPERAAQLRVHALVVGPSRIGLAEANVRVVQPVKLLVTAPRVLTAGDEAEVPVIVESHAQPGAHEAVISAEVSGPHVSLVGEATQRVMIDPREWSKRHALRVVRLRASADAPRDGAQATLTITSRVGGHTTRVTREVRVRPTRQPIHAVRVIETTADAVDLAPLLKGWDPARTEARVWLTPSTEAAVLAHINPLLERPRGTLDEITLATLPLLALLDVWPLIEPVVDWDQHQARAMIQDAVWRALGMQRPSGGLAVGRERDHIDPIGSARAVWMLWQAQRAGFEVPRDRLDAALTWLHDTTGRAADPDAEARMHWWLARMGRGKKARALQLLKAISSEPRGEEVHRKLLLLAALHVMGDQRGESTLRAWALDPERAADQMHLWGSERRALVAELMQIALIVFGRDSAQRLRPYDALVRHLSSALTGRAPERWAVETRADALVSLAMWLRGSAVLPARGELVVGQGDGARVVAERADAAGRWLLSALPEQATLRVRRASAGRVAVVVSLRGERLTSAVAPAGVRLEQARFDLTGAPITDRPVRLGEQVYVRLKIANTMDRPAHDLAITARLPAGLFFERVAWFDRELPRALRGARHTGPWQQRNTLGLRDEVTLHGALGPGEVSELILVTRAVTSGTFTSPALLLHDAYNPEAIVGLDATTLRVEAPWTAAR